MPTMFSIPAGSTLYVPFDSYAADGASGSISGLAVTDIEIYKNGSVTQRASDAGYTLLDTDGIDIDGVTGLNGFSIDLSDNTDSGFFAVGSQYWVVVSSITVAGETVNFTAAWFRITEAEATTGRVMATAAAVSNDAITAAAIADNAIDAGAIAANAITSAKIADDTITAAKIAADAITSAKIADNAIAAAKIADNAITAAKIAADAITAAKIAADAITAAKIAAGAIDAATFAADTGFIIRANTAQAGAATTITLDASASAVTDFYTGELITVTAGAGAGQSRQIIAYNGTTKVATVAAWATNPDNTSVFAIHPFTTIAGGGGGGLDAAGVRAAVGLASANLDTQLAKLDTIDDFLDTEVAAIKAKTDNLPTDPADASDIATAFSGVNTKLDAIDDFLDTEVAAIKTKTDALPSDPADASDIATSFGTVNSTLATISAFIDTEVAAIKAKTDNLPSDPADASDIATSFGTVNGTLATIAAFIDTEVAAIKAKTDNLPAIPASQGDVTGLLTTVMTESYAANGQPMTAAQALYAIMQGLLNHGPISGTNWPVKKLDGSQAFNTTLNSAGDPTARSR
jgi:hypothetical protein